MTDLPSRARKKRKTAADARLRAKFSSERLGVPSRAELKSSDVPDPAAQPSQEDLDLKLAESVLSRAKAIYPSSSIREQFGFPEVLQNVGSSEGPEETELINPELGIYLMLLGSILAGGHSGNSSADVSSAGGTDTEQV